MIFISKILTVKIKHDVDYGPEWPYIINILNRNFVGVIQTYGTERFHVRLMAQRSIYKLWQTVPHRCRVWMHPFNTKLLNNEMHKSVESLSQKKTATVLKITELFDGKCREIPRPNSKRKIFSGNFMFSSESRQFAER